MAGEFKKCPNGHYYQGNECPYCRSHPSEGKDSITIGSNIENDLIVNNNTVAGIHCRIERIGEERYRIIDLQSENGTYVNGQRLNGSMEIGPLDVIRVGDTNVQWLHQFAAPDRWDDHYTMGFIEPPEDFFPHQDPTDNKDCLTPKTKELKWEYHQCPNGHYYKGDGPCPFCHSTKPPKEEKEDDELKVCHNLHAYDAKLNKCPICDSSIIVDEITWNGSDTVRIESIYLDRPVQIKMGDKDTLECKCIEVLSPMGSSYKLCYAASNDHFSPYERMSVDIEPDKNVLFGDTTLTGRELMRLCDLILDNRKELSSSNASYVDARVDDLIQLNELIKRVTSEQIEATYEDKQQTNFINKTKEFRKCSFGHYYRGEECPYCYKGVPEWLKDNISVRNQKPSDVYEKGGLYHDKVELTDKYKAVIEVVEKEVDDMLKNHPSYKQMGYCHFFWEKKKKILKDKYSIEWRSPSELNPETSFD